MVEIILIFATLFLSVALSQICNICLLLIYLGILTKYIKNPDTFDKIASYMPEFVDKIASLFSKDSE